MYIISDTHLQKNEKIKFPDDDEFFIHLGDYGELNDQEKFNYRVLGNHDFWGHDLCEVPAKQLDLEFGFVTGIVHTNWYGNHSLLWNLSVKNNDYNNILTVKGKTVEYANRVFDNFSKEQVEILAYELDNISTQKVFLFVHVPVITTSYDKNSCWFYDNNTYNLLLSYEKIDFTVFAGHVHRSTYVRERNITQITLLNNKWMEVL